MAEDSSFELVDLKSSGQTNIPVNSNMPTASSLQLQDNSDMEDRNNGVSKSLGGKAAAEFERRVRKDIEEGRLGPGLGARKELHESGLGGRKVEVVDENNLDLRNAENGDTEKKGTGSEVVEVGLRLKSLLSAKRQGDKGTWRLSSKPRPIQDSNEDSKGVGLPMAVIIVVGLIGLARGLWSHSGLSIEDVQNSLTASNQCILVEGGGPWGLDCSKVLLEELLAQGTATGEGLRAKFWDFLLEGAQRLPSINPEFSDSVNPLMFVIPVVSLMFATVLALFWRARAECGLVGSLNKLCSLFALGATFIILAYAIHNHAAAREAELARLQGTKELMKQEFTDWLGQGQLLKPEGGIQGTFHNLREFHRCKALEDVDKEAFKGIIDNMAQVLEISSDRKEEIQLAAHAHSMVNVLEDFEHGPQGLYTYGKYQTLKRANGNMDIVFAIHAFKWDRDEGLGAAKLSMTESKMWKTQFRSEAMKLFEADCPQQLVTDLRLQERRDEQRQLAESEQMVRREILNLYSEARARIHQQKEEEEEKEAASLAGGWGKIF